MHCIYFRISIMNLSTQTTLSNKEVDLLSGVDLKLNHPRQSKCRPSNHKCEERRGEKAGL